LASLRHNLYYIIMCFARFNLFVLSYTFMLSSFPARESPLFKLRMLEIVGIAFFWTWFGALLRGIDGTGNTVLFLLVSFAVTSPLHVQVCSLLPNFNHDLDRQLTGPFQTHQIVLSHFSQPVSVTSDMIPHTELLESHAHRQLRTTMDISCPTYLDFLHGGLNFQTPHHLFPRIPRFRFRAVALEVAKWVEEERELVKDGTWEGEKLKENEGLIYKHMSFVEGNRDVLGVLQAVGQQVRGLALVTRSFVVVTLR
jgi:delta8-fatty-acid desaturase